MKLPPKKSPQSEKLRDASARLSAKSTQLASKSERLIARAHKATREQQAPGRFIRFAATVQSSAAQTVANRQGTWFS